MNISGIVSCILFIDVAMFFMVMLVKREKIFAFLFGIFLMVFLDDLFLKGLNYIKSKGTNGDVDKLMFIVIVTVNFTKIVLINLAIKEKFKININRKEATAFFIMWGAIIISIIKTYTIIGEIIAYIVIYICLIRSLDKLRKNIDYRWSYPYYLIYKILAVFGMGSAVLAIIQDIQFSYNNRILNILPKDIQYNNVGSKGIKLFMCVLSICTVIHTFNRMKWKKD